jgi:LCP family protein required for cell wall assembly
MTEGPEVPKVRSSRNAEPGLPARRKPPANRARASRRPGTTGPGRSRFALPRGYVVSCVLAALVLVASGFSYLTVREVGDIGSSNAIVSGPSTGAQNILLMGIESRRYWNGQILPPSILAKLHAGSARAVANGVGGNDTNTLILIHIFANGTKAVGFSIPRDDWVQFAGTVGPEQTGKIDQAYGVSMFYKEQQLSSQDPGISQDQLAMLGNEAGQAAAVATVEKLTGVHVDHFAAVNLYGFYELAKVLGGVEVCLRHAVRDKNSGANFHAGYQHLDAAQALAFVRQRDGLPNGDLDRTHRQQAFIDSVMHQLRQDGALSDLTKIQALLTVAKHYVITDSGWNLLDFAAEARNLTSGNLVFHTLPIVGYATFDGQDANVVNPPYIQQIVQAAFYPPPAPKPGTRPTYATKTSTGRPVIVDVLNGGDVTGLAHRVSAALARAGFEAGAIGDTSARTSTAVLYGLDAAASGQSLAKVFGTQATASATVPPGQVEVLLGASATVPVLRTGGASPSPSQTPVVAPTTGPQGGAVTAKDGIPCVN